MPLDDKTLNEVGVAVDLVVGRYARFGWVSVVDKRDMKQEAWRVSLETLSRGNYDPSKPLGGYIYTAVNRQLGNSVSRWTSQVSLGRDVWEKDRTSPTTTSSLGEWGDREGQKSRLQSKVPSILIQLPQQDDGTARSEWKVWRENWEKRFTAAMADSQRGFDQEQRDIIEMRYGLAGRDQITPLDISRLLGRPIKSITKLLERFAKAARGNLALYSLLVELTEMGTKDEASD